MNKKSIIFYIVAKKRNSSYNSKKDVEIIVRKSKILLERVDTKVRDITIKDILTCTGGNLIVGNENLICKEFSKDTRTIKEGDIYIGIKGENFDGNVFWKKALDNGAMGVIVQNIEFDEQYIETYQDKIIIEVEDTLQALYKLASYKRDIYDVPVIAITGSVGKTSTKDLVANVIAQKYKICKTVGNNNNNIGMPFTILNAPNDIEAFVLEMGMNHFGEIQLLSEIAKPNICIITNIGTSHIGNLGSRENILKAKLEILDGAKNPHMVINNDNDLLHKWYEENKHNINIKTYGIHEKSDIQAKEIQLHEDGSEYHINLKNKEENIKVPVGGEHFVLNSLCAIAVGELLDIENNDIQKGIETFSLTKNRMEIIELKNGIKLINDAYNSSVESVKASLAYMTHMKANRRIAVLGDILETGKFAVQLHKEIGEIVCENHVDMLVCSGENAKYIVESAKENGFDEKHIYYFENKEEIVKLLKQMIQPEDVILFKASNGMRFFDIAEKIEKEFK